MIVKSFLTDAKVEQKEHVNNKLSNGSPHYNFLVLGDFHLFAGPHSQENKQDSLEIQNLTIDFRNDYLNKWTRKNDMA